MIDLKQKPQSPVTMLGDVAEDGSYPDGTKIELKGEMLRALGFGESTMPQVGQKFEMRAMVEVVEVCKEDGQNSTEYCVEFQLQQIELGNEQQMADQQIKRMFA